MRNYLALIIVLLTACQSTPKMTDEEQNHHLKIAQNYLAQKRYDEAFLSFQALAEQQLPLAEFTLALFYQNGWGRKTNEREACVWFEKSAQHQIIAAEHLFAQCLEKNILGSAQPEKATIWYEKAARHGHQISWCSIAKIYVEGLISTDNMNQKLENCLAFADSDNILAQVQMGHFFLNKNTATHDPQKAKYWFSRAAQQNSLEAMYYLGIVEQSFMKNVAQARFWFESAASQGYLPAYFVTATLYFKEPSIVGTDVREPENLAKAYLWLTATSKRSKNDKALQETAEMLEKIKAVMPETWYKDLDQKVERHLQEHVNKTN